MHYNPDRSKSPLQSATDIDQASLERLQDQMRFELATLLRSSTQEELAHMIGYDTGSQVSRILNGFADLPVARARELDARGFKTSLSTSFELLANAAKIANMP